MERKPNEGSSVIEQEYELVDVEKLQEHPDNPRRGDEAAIAESMEVNGWFGAVVAQKSTGNILAGNHRYRVAKARGMQQVPVVWVDVEEEAARKILLSDNRSAELGSYDEVSLQALLADLEDLSGTGWAEGAIKQIEAEEEAEKAAEDAVPADKYDPQYAVMLVVQGEEDQEEIYGLLQRLQIKAVEAGAASALVEAELRLVSV